MNDKSVLNPKMLDLLVEWEESKVSGVAVTLEEICAQCPEQIDELRRHVTQMAHVEALFDQVEADSPPQLPGFDQLEQIGRGGMGIVYKARDIQLDQIVAIKVPFSSQSGGNSRKRFERETKTLAKLRHKNIVQVRSAGIAEDTPYLVMDYVPGGNLAERMQEVAGEPKQAAQLISQVARAVDHAHRAGIIHRDLKPGNILLSDEGEPLVSDFGVAAVLLGEPLQSRPSAETPNERHSPQETRITNTAAVGTPAYLPPEAHSGAPVSVAAATDVWSLGVILYECLTGLLPYPEVEPGVRDFKIPPPRPHSIRREIPRGLEQIIDRCLTIDPAKRYPAAASIADDLERWVRRVEVGQRARKFGLYGAAGAAALLLFALLVRPPTLEERHTNAARELTKALTRTNAVELAGPTGRPKTHFLRVNQPLASSGVSESGHFFAECTRPCLVELLPDVPADHYLFTAELRQITGRGDCEVGLYCGHAESKIPPTAGHRFIFLSFADLGLLSNGYENKAGKASSGLSLRGFRYFPSDTGMWEHRALQFEYYDPARTQPGPWRRISLEVSPDQLIGKCDHVALRPSNLDPISKTYASPRYPRGSIGIYVNNCNVEIRNCRVELLSNP